MKIKLYHAALVAALGWTGATAVHAQANYNPGDLLVGFTTQSGSDLIYDLGAAGSLYNGETWSGLSSLLTSSFGTGTNLNGLYWGVLGNTANTGTARTAFTTTFAGLVPNTVANAQMFANLNNAARAIATDFSGITISAGQSATPLANGDNSWNQQTLSGAFNTQYLNVYENPNVQGVTSADFSQVLYTGGSPTLLGNFSLGADGSFTYSGVAAVPEPTTCSLLAGAGILLAVFRKKLRRREASLFPHL